MLRFLEGFDLLRQTDDSNSTLALARKKYVTPGLQTYGDTATDHDTDFGNLFTLYPAAGTQFQGGRYDVGYSLYLGASTFVDYRFNCDGGDNNCNQSGIIFGTITKVPIPTVISPQEGILGFAVKFTRLAGINGGSPVPIQSDGAGQAVCAIGVDGNPGSDYPWFLLYASTNNKLNLHIQSDTTNPLQHTGTSESTNISNSSQYRGIFYNTNTSDRGYSGSTLTENVWYNIGIKYLFDNSNGYIKVYLNDSLVLNVTSLTPNVGTLNVNALYLCNGYIDPDPASAPYEYLSADSFVISNTFDDFYLFDNIGPRNNNYIGNFRIRPAYLGSDIITQGTNMGGYSTHSLSLIDSDNDLHAVDLENDEREIFRFNQFMPSGASICGVGYTYSIRDSGSTYNTLDIIPLCLSNNVQYSGLHNVQSYDNFPNDYKFYTTPIESSIITNNRWSPFDLNYNGIGFTLHDK